MLLNTVSITITLYDLLIFLGFASAYVIIPIIFYFRYYNSYTKLCAADQKVRWGVRVIDYDVLNQITAFGALERREFSWKKGPFRIKEYIESKKRCDKIKKKVHDAFPEVFKQEIRSDRLKDLLN